MKEIEDIINKYNVPYKNLSDYESATFIINNMVTKIEKGQINTDFIEDRITIKAYLKSGGYIPCKLYGDGRLVSFTGDGEDNYTEAIMSDERDKEIRALL